MTSQNTLSHFDQIESAFEALQAWFDPINPAVHASQPFFDMSYPHLNVLAIVNQPVKARFNPRQAVLNLAQHRHDDIGEFAHHRLLTTGTLMEHFCGLVNPPDMPIPLCPPRVIAPFDGV